MKTYYLAYYWINDCDYFYPGGEYKTLKSCLKSVAEHRKKHPEQPIFVEKVTRKTIKKFNFK